MIHFNVELWNIHQLCVLQVLNEKETILARKVEKLTKAEMSRHRKDQAEPKPETKIVVTSHNSVATSHNSIET